MSLIPIQLEGRPVLLAHIPKTGGSSIRAGRRVGDRLLVPDGFPQAILHPEWYRPFPLNLHDVPCLAIVRDPLDRAESAWRDFRFTRRLTGLPFTEFVRLARRATDSMIVNPTTAEHHLAPMVHPAHGLQHATFIARYTHLLEDWHTFCDQLGITAPPLPHKRVSSGPKVEWTIETIDLVHHIYAQDIWWLESKGLAE